MPLFSEVSTLAELPAYKSGAITRAANAANKEIVGDDQDGADKGGDDEDWEAGLSDGEYGRALAVLAEEGR